MKSYERIEKAIKFYLAHFKDQPSVGDVALEVGLSESHFKRTFKEWAGVPPKKFLSVITTEFAKSNLEASHSILDLAFSSGLSGQGRLYDHTVSLFAMTPGEMKSGGLNLIVNYGYSESPFGAVLIFFSDRGISQMDFMTGAESEYVDVFKSRWPKATLVRSQKLAAEKIEDIYNPKSKSELKVQLNGTNFQLNVWKALIQLPPGSLISYGHLARFLKKPKAHRAVATAVGKNPVAHLIPCHRVIRESGLVGGYRWGVPRKCALMGLEALGPNS